MGFIAPAITTPLNWSDSALDVQGFEPGNRALRLVSITALQTAIAPKQ